MYFVQCRLCIVKREKLIFRWKRRKTNVCRGREGGKRSTEGRQGKQRSTEGRQGEKKVYRGKEGEKRSTEGRERRRKNLKGREEEKNFKGRKRKIYRGKEKRCAEARERKEEGMKFDAFYTIYSYITPLKNVVNELTKCFFDEFGG